MKKGKLIVLSAPSGTGKTTITKETKTTITKEHKCNICNIQ